MRLLVSGATVDVDAVAHTPIAKHHLGRLYVPRSREVIRTDLPWAIDNGAFSGFEYDAFVALLDRARGTPGCLWVAAPDTVSDHAMTLRSFWTWQSEIWRRGLPVAFVLQDGATVSNIPWHGLDCLFIGGSTTFKESTEALSMARAAKTRGKLVHVGRVSTLRRIRLWRGLADSFDSSAHSRFPRKFIGRSLMEVALGLDVLEYKPRRQSNANDSQLTFGRDEA